MKVRTKKFSSIKRLMRESKRGHWRQVLIMLNTCEWDSKSRALVEILGMAVADAELGVVERLIKMGVSIKRRISGIIPMQPLHLAVERGDVQMVMLLLSYGASVDVRLWGLAPVDYAIMNNDDKLIRVLNMDLKKDIKSKKSIPKSR